MTRLVAIAAALALHAEHGGNPHAPVRDNGRAVGIAQAWPVAVRECNRVAGTRYTPQDRLDPVASVRMVKLTLAWHARRNPRLDAVMLAARWRNPNGACPQWHVRKLREAQRELEMSGL